MLVKRGSYWYRDRSKNPYVWKRCQTCGVEEFILKSGAYCSYSCAKEGGINRKPLRCLISMTEYKRYHARVYRKYGYANKCSLGCTVGPFQWTNLTENWSVLDDYIQMCCSCHYRFDRYRVAVIQ